MRWRTAIATIVLCTGWLAACSKAPMPTGRWEGTYESADTLIVARLQINPGGDIFISAPDATNVAAIGRAS